MKQTTFAGLAFDAKKKRTRREQFLSEMDAVIPWTRLLALLEPHYPLAGQGRRPLGLERMPRIYFMQQWFNLSDPAAEDTLYDSESMRRPRPRMPIKRATPRCVRPGRANNGISA